MLSIRSSSILRASIQSVSCCKAKRFGRSSVLQLVYSADGVLRNQRLFSSSPLASAGHSKWQNIKHRKARQDAERSTQNTKIANQIYMAAREGGSTDPTINIRLATAIENASKISTPKKVIEGAIARAAKSAGAAENAQSIAYEGVGPGGVAYIIEVLTENRNRTAQQVRAAFLKFKGSLSPTAFLFKRRGWIDVSPNVKDYDTVLEQCLETEIIEDIVQDEEDQTITIYTDPADLAAGAEVVREKFGIDDMGLAYVPDPEQSVAVSDEEILQRLVKFEAELDKIEDVNNVYNNLVCK